MTGQYISYLGPVARCKIEQVVKSETLEGCANRTCVRFQHKFDAPFCSACGQTKGTFTKNRYEPAVDRWTVVPDDALAGFDNCDDTDVIYIPNTERGAPREFTFDPHYAFETPFPADGSMVSQELDWFKSAFAEELEILRRAYGPEHVRIEWTLLSTVM